MAGLMFAFRSKTCRMNCYIQEIMSSRNYSLVTVNKEVQKMLSVGNSRLSRTRGQTHHQCQWATQFRRYKSDDKSFLEKLTQISLSRGNVNILGSKVDAFTSLYPTMVQYIGANIFWPGFIKTMIDPQFSKEAFLTGAQQAVETVSKYLLHGQFEELKGLVEEKTLQELESELQPGKHPASAMDILGVMGKEVAKSNIQNIGVIFDDKRGEKFVEITTFFSFHFPNDSSDEILIPMVVCVYRFIRNYTKGAEDSWTINRLNHIQFLKPKKENNVQE